MSILQNENIKKFVLGGRAKFTISNTETGGRFTFKVASKDEGKIHFVKVLTGEDNESDFSYLGFIRDGKFIHGGSKTWIGKDAPSAVAFAWFWSHMSTLPERVEVRHEGHCGRCGRALTVPESIDSGFGPHCLAAMNGG